MNANFIRLAFQPAVLMVVALSVNSCGKNPVAPSITEPATVEKTPVTATQAQRVAEVTGRGFAGTTSLEFARSLFFPARRAGAGTAPTARPARTGGLTATHDVFTDVFNYEAEPFDALGRAVSWETTDWNLIHRVVMRWSMTREWVSATDSSSFRGSATGRYDVSGLTPESPELLLSGTANDALSYRLLLENADLAGRADGQASFSDLRLSKGGRSYPLAGSQTIVTNQHGMVLANGERTSDDFAANVVIAFNGTRWATLTVDGLYRFRLDLDTGVVESPPA